MALVINDRVKENSTTTGAGAIALGGVVIQLTMQFIIKEPLNGKLV